MVRSLLNNWSTLEIVAVSVLASVVLAVGISIAIRRLIPDIAERQFEDIASGLRVVYELLFALILAFVIASVLEKFNDAESAVAAEAAALQQMHVNNLAFRGDDQERLDMGIGGYVAAVVRDEWDTMKEGRASPDAAAALETMYALYAEFDPPPGAASEFYKRALDHLDTVADARRERLALSTAKLPAILVIMLPIGVLLLLILEYRPKLAPRSQAVFMGTLALVLSSTYLLTIVLDYPFSGDVSVSREPLQSGGLNSFLASTPRKPQSGDTPLELTAEGLAGTWRSEAFGTILLRPSDGEIRGAYRVGNGTVRGRITAGVFRGVWCEDTRSPQKADAGLVQWRLVRTADGDEIVPGVFSFGYASRPDGSFEPGGGWDLSPVKLDRAIDLERRLDRDEPSERCQAPPP